MGVLALMIMGFFTLVLMLGRPTAIRVIDEIVHPMDSPTLKVSPLTTVVLGEWHISLSDMRRGLCY